MPLIGFASFPVIIGDQECERIIVSLQYDINQKIDNNQYKIHDTPYTSRIVEENPTNQVLILKNKNFFKSLVISLLSILLITFLISLLPIFNTNDSSPFGA